jgi:hypothetical protein
MLHVESFWYRSNDSTLVDRTEIGESLHVWIHSEKDDEDNHAGVLRKMFKNISWLAKKIGCTVVTLHSFAHLDDSKADPGFADSLIEEVASKLREREYDVHIVPFGHFYEFNLHVKGPSLAKVFKRII